MFVVASHWMPRAMPETAETTKAAVRTAITTTSRPLPASPTQPRISTPLPICSAPSPSEAAEPNSVAKMASTSMVLPAQPSVRRRPNSGAKAELRSEEHTSELQSRQYLVCRLLLEKKRHVL